MGRETVYVYATDDSVNDLGDRSVCYRIDPYAEDCISLLHTDKQLLPVLEKDLHGGFGFTGWGSKLFAFGGENFSKSKSKIKCFDTVYCYELPAKEGPCIRSSSCGSWEELTSAKMIGPRLDPVAVPTDDNIFIFGSSLPTSPWGEVFCPNSGEFSILSPVPGKLETEDKWVAAAAVMETEKKMFLLTYDKNNKNIYCLDYSSKPYKWEQFSTSPPHAIFLCCSLRNAIVDDMLYVLAPRSVYAYHISRNRWIQNPVQGFGEILRPHYYDVPGSIFHLGDNLLFLVYGMAHNLIDTALKLHWVRFRVFVSWDTLSQDCVSIRAQVEANGVYEVPGTLYIDACVM